VVYSTDLDQTFTRSLKIKIMTNQTVADIGEFGFIQRIQSILGKPNDDVLVGLGDDTATFIPQKRPMIVSTDAMVEDVHFRLDWTNAKDLAHKALASSLSDLAAKAAEPAYAVITLGLPGHTKVSWMEEFYHSLAEKTKQWHTQIIGGDTVSSQKLWISLTVWGYQTTQHPIEIRNAQLGDKIIVTGYLGDAAGGLKLLLDGHNVESEYQHYLINRFSCPAPRIDEALSITKYITPTTMTDISDGISRDLKKVCDASQVGARLDATKFPISNQLNEVFNTEAINTAWQGGEDYELLLTVSPHDADELMEQWDQSLCPLTITGKITESAKGIQVEGLALTNIQGFDHYKK
jgi:thiamine-monophosphate kinase